MYRLKNTDYLGLRSLCQQFLTPKSVVVEIGSYWGEGSMIFANICAAVYCVDPWRDYKDGDKVYEEMVEVEAHFDCKISLLNNVHKFRTTSEMAAKVMADRIADLVYVDGLKNPTDYRKDLDRWWPKVKDGGILSGRGYKILKPTVDEWCKNAGKQYGTVDWTYSDDSWAIVKK